MNKTEALQRLAAAEQEIAACKAIINAPYKPESPVFRPNRCSFNYTLE